MSKVDVEQALRAFSRAGKFNSVPWVDLRAFARSARVREYARGSIICGPRERTTVDLVLSGRCRRSVFVVGSKGADLREATLGVYGEGDVLGVAAAVSTGYRLGWVVADDRSDVTLAEFDRDVYMRYLRGNYPAYRQAILGIVHRLRVAEDRVWESVTLDAPRRVHAYLWGLPAAEECPCETGKRVALRSQAEVGRVLGIRRETVCKAISKLAEWGVVRRFGPGKLWVADIETIYGGSNDKTEAAGGPNAR